MASIAIDSTNDVVIENNDLKLITGVDGVAQVLRQRLRVFRGEWFLDTREGLPYFEEVLKKNPNPVTVDSLFKNEILNSPGIIELQSFLLEINGRELSLKFTALTEFGILLFDEDL